LAGFKTAKDELDKLGVSVAAASVDPEDKAAEVAAELNFPVAFGVTRAQADLLGAFWEERRQIIQPAEFILNDQRKVVVSSYSDGPLGRIDAADVVKLVNFYESQKKK